LIDMRNTMPIGASVTITGIRGHDAGICDLPPRSRWPESLVTIPECAVTMKRNTQGSRNSSFELKITRKFST